MAEDRTVDRELQESDEAYFDGVSRERSFDTRLLRDYVHEMHYAKRGEPDLEYASCYLRG